MSLKLTEHGQTKLHNRDVETVGGGREGRGLASLDAPRGFGVAIVAMSPKIVGFGDAA